MHVVTTTAYHFDNLRELKEVLGNLPNVTQEQNIPGVLTLQHKTGQPMTAELFINPRTGFINSRSTPPVDASNK
jgi:hypothetical protein